MIFFTTPYFLRKLLFGGLFFLVSLHIFSLDGAYSVNTIKAQNGKNVVFYTFSYFEENEFIHSEFGFKKVQFNVSLKEVLIDSSKKNVEVNNVNEQLVGSSNVAPYNVRKILEDRMEEHYKNWKERNFQYLFEESINCVFSDDTIMTFSFYTTSYTGGAHGSYTTIYENYSLQSGKNIGKTIDLIQNPADEKLLALLRQKLLDNDGKTLKKDDFFEFDKIVLCDNFFPDKKGITFLYNIYDILPYSYGATKVFFKFTELLPFVSTESPYRYLFE